MGKHGFDSRAGHAVPLNQLQQPAHTTEMRAIVSIDTTPFEFDPAGLSEGIEQSEDNSPYANLDPELRTEAEAGALATLFGVLAASAATAELEERGKTDSVYARLARLSMDYAGEVADLMVDEDVDPEVDAHFMVAVGKVVGATLAALRTALSN